MALANRNVPRHDDPCNAENYSRSVVVKPHVAEIKRPIVDLTTVDGAVGFLESPLDAVKQTRHQATQRFNGDRKTTKAQTLTYNPITGPYGSVIEKVNEENLSIERFKTQCTYTIAGDILCLPIYDDLNTVDVPNYNARAQLMNTASIFSTWFLPDSLQVDSVCAEYRGCIGHKLPDFVSQDGPTLSGRVSYFSSLPALLCRFPPLLRAGLATVQSRADRGKR